MELITFKTKIKQIVTLKRICNNETIYKKKYEWLDNFDYDYKPSDCDDFDGSCGGQIEQRLYKVYCNWSYFIDENYIKKDFSFEELKQLIKNNYNLTKEDETEMNEIMGHKILTQYKRINYQAYGSIRIQHIITLQYTNL